MNQYIYYNKRDSSQEPQGTIQAQNIAEAIEIASGIKRMDVEAFTQIFKIKNYERKIQKSFRTNR